MKNNIESDFPPFGNPKSESASAQLGISYNKREPLDFGLICCAPGIHPAAVARLSGRAAQLLASS